jgi:hypothetical protein
MSKILEISKQNDMSAKKAAKVVKPVKVVKPIKNNLYAGGDGEPFKPTSDGIPDLEPMTPDQLEIFAEGVRQINQDDYDSKLIGKFLMDAQGDKESRYTIMVGGPKGRVVIERLGANATIVFSHSLIEAIQKISG